MEFRLREIRYFVNKPTLREGITGTSFTYFSYLKQLKESFPIRRQNGLKLKCLGTENMSRLFQAITLFA